MKLTLPNTLTLLRIMFIPILIVLFYCSFSGSRLVCSALFGLACLTDWFDGYWARKYNQTSAFGAFLDPVADKLIVAVSLVLLVEQHHSVFITLPSAIIIGREIIISALREWMAELGKRKHVAVSALGKVKTLTQMLAIGTLLAYKTGKWQWLNALGTSLLYVAALLTLYSMVQYLIFSWPLLQEAEQ